MRARLSAYQAITGKENHMTKSVIKKILILLLPLLLFFILLVPYSYVNSEFIVDWLGCGCPKVDVETGEMIHDYFSANDFTAYFWLAVSLCVTVASAFLTKLLPKNKVWLKILYVVLMLVASLFISYQFIQVMMWN